ncbi:MAG: HtaA domain-containing protein [Solirubrobacterales bacterium]
MSSSFASRPTTAALALVAVLSVVILALSGAVANAAETTGTATITIGNGKSGKVLSGKKGKTSAVAPAKAKKLGKKTRIQAEVKTLTVAKTSKAALKGGIKLKYGKRKVKATGLKLSISSKKTLVKGKLGGKSMTIFKVNGKAKADLEGNSVKVNSSKLNLTSAAGKKLRKSLKLKKRPSGKVGTFVFYGKVTEAPVDPCVANPEAEGCGPVVLTDPYMAQCGVEATSQAVPGLPAAQPLPVLAGAQSSTAPATFSWGLKASFRAYINFAAGGSLHALDGATRDGFGPTAGFNFNVADSTYTSNGTADPDDDQAIINGSGTSLFCGTGHGFRVAISNPTVVIDGANSRIVADIDTNLTGVWTSAQRVDVADLDLAAAQPTYNKSGAEITWADVPATLSTAMDGVIPGYAAGAALDPITVGATVTTGTDFPRADYCDVTTGTISAWPETPGQLAPVASITGGAATDGSLEWGIRQGLRGMNPGNPIVVTTSGDVTSSDGADMTGAGKYFTWPVGETAGVHSPGEAGLADDKLVLPLGGTVGLCSEAHGYGSVYSNPRVVIDGANSRISIDVAARVGVDWLRSTVDFVKFDASAITPTSTPVGGGDELTWVVPDGAPTLTADGSKIIKVLSGTYVEDAAFQGFTVSAVVAGE